MSLFQVIIFLVCYYFTGILFNRYPIDDARVNVYKYAINRNRGDILESIRGGKVYKMRAMMDDSDEDELTDEISEEISELTRTYTNPDYAEEKIDDYIKNAKKSLFWCRVNNLLITVSKELLYLTPLIFLALYGNLVISLAISLLVMTSNSIALEYGIRNTIEEYYPEESDDVKNGLDLRYKFKIISFVLLSQVPFYAVLLISALIK